MGPEDLRNIMRLMRKIHTSMKEEPHLPHHEIIAMMATVRILEKCFENTLGDRAESDRVLDIMARIADLIATEAITNDEFIRANK